MKKQMSRREFLRLSALASAGLTMAACAVPPPATEPAPAQEAAQATEAAAEAATATPPPAEEVTLHIMHNWADTDAKGPPLQSIFSDFTETYPNITLEQEVFTDEEIPIKVETAYLAGEEPDIVLHNLMANSLTWTEDGLTVPIDDYLVDWGLKDKFLETALRQWQNPQGHYSAFPLEGFNWPMWYNTRILGEAGAEIPTTMDELMAAIPKIQEAGYAPIVTGGADWTGWAQFGLTLAIHMDYYDTAQPLFAQGGLWEDPAGIAGVETFVQIRDAGGFAEETPGLDFGGRNEYYYSGKAAMMHGGSWVYSETPEELWPDITLAGFPLPEGSPHEKPLIYAAYRAKGVWITRNGAEKLDAARELVEFMYQSNMIARLVEQSSMPPPLKEVQVDESKLNPLFVQSLKLADQVDVMPAVQGEVPGAARPDLLNMAKEAYTDVTAQEILDAIQAAYEAAM
jgi:multiple sugar transport system substrate-binding protein